MEGIQEVKEGLKAKDASLFGKITGGAEVLIGTIVLIVLTCCGTLTVSEAKELFSLVLYCGFAMAGMFGTVDINLMLEKFTKRKEQ